MTDDRMSEGGHIPSHYERGGPSQYDRDLYDPGRGASFGDMYAQRDGPAMDPYMRGTDGMLVLDVQMMEDMRRRYEPDDAPRRQHEEETPNAPAGGITAFFFG